MLDVLVLYVGIFSKILFLGLCIGFLVLFFFVGEGVGWVLFELLCGGYWLE